MKKFILILAMMLISINLYSSPPDSCLKMICVDGETYFDPINEQWIGTYNPDSVRVDSCFGSQTFGKLFTKRYFYLQFYPNYYPFDTILMSDTIKRVSDLSSLKPDLKIIFQQLETQFGSIYFQGLPNEEKDSITFLNPVIRITFTEYQNIDEILNTFKSEIDTLKNIIYESRFGHAVSVNEYKNEQQLISIAYNSVKDIIELKVLSNEIFSDISIYNLQGEVVYKNEFTEIINVSYLPRSIYFLKLGNNTYKFIKE